MDFGHVIEDSFEIIKVIGQSCFETFNCKDGFHQVLRRENHGHLAFSSRELK